MHIFLGIIFAFVVCVTAYTLGVETTRWKAEDEELQKMFYSCDAKGGYTVPTRHKGRYLCIDPSAIVKRNPLP